MRKFLVLICFFVSTAGFAQYRLYENGLKKYINQDYPGSIELLTDFLKSSLRDKKFDIDAFYYRGLANYKTNEYRKAIDDFEESILLDHPNKGNIYWFMAKSYSATNSSSESLASYNSALRLLDSNTESKAKLLLERSQEYRKVGNIELAYADLTSVALLEPGNTVVRSELAKLEKENEKLRGSGVADEKKDTPTATKPSVKQEVVETTKTEVAPPVAQPVVQPAPTLADFYSDEKRFALVIGNAAYPKEIGVLKNPVNDATDFAAALRDSNFEVTLLTNATYGQIRAAMLRFKERVDENDRDKTVSLFYYAGHGLQSEDENYLVPVDAKVEYEDDIVRYCFPVQRMVLSNMERSNSRMNIVILDACRNNPFPSLTRSLGQVGLGDMRRARGSFIAYATAPGSVASDGQGRNGLYTQELIKAVSKPGLTIEQVFKEVRQNVLRLSGDRQNTWDSSNIVGEFYFRF
jgi:tetratricopeptide (TPR) repeat protein